MKAGVSPDCRLTGPAVLRDELRWSAHGPVCRLPIVRPGHAIPVSVHTLPRMMPLKDGQLEQDDGRHQRPENTVLVRTISQERGHESHPPAEDISPRIELAVYLAGGLVDLVRCHSLRPEDQVIALVVREVVIEDPILG